MTAPVPEPVTTPAKTQEADAAGAAFQAALLVIGVETLQDALALWADVPPVQTASAAASWLTRATALVLARRRMARDLALSYYRLVRALRTGATIPDPANPKPESVSLAELRSEFQRLVTLSQADVPGTEPVDSPAPTSDTPDLSQEDSAGQTEESIAGDDKLIPIEDLGEDLAQLEDELEQDAMERAKEILANLGPLAQQKAGKKIDTAQPAKQVDEARKEANDLAGSRQAAAAETGALDGARGTLWSLADRDKRVYGWARVSRTGTPCGFCAMLISRGAVYKSQQSAQYDDGDLYHVNCHCYAELMFSLSQYENDPRFALNREYSALWPQVTKGLSGNDALNAWRRYIDGLRRANPSQDTETPAVSST